MEPNNRYKRITGFFPNKSGNGMSVKVKGDIAAALAGIEEGDMLFLNGVDTDRPSLSYAKSDPTYVGSTVEPASAALNAYTGAPPNRATQAPKKPTRVEKF